MEKVRLILSAASSSLHHFFGFLLLPPLNLNGFSCLEHIQGPSGNLLHYGISGWLNNNSDDNTLSYKTTLKLSLFHHCAFGKTSSP